MLPFDRARRCVRAAARHSCSLTTQTVHGAATPAGHANLAADATVAPARRISSTTRGSAVSAAGMDGCGFATDLTIRRRACSRWDVIRRARDHPKRRSASCYLACGRAAQVNPLRPAPPIADRTVTLSRKDAKNAKQKRFGGVPVSGTAAAMSSALLAKRKEFSLWSLRPLRLCGSSQGHRTGHQQRSVREAKEPVCSARSAALRLISGTPHRPSAALRSRSERTALLCALCGSAAHLRDSAPAISSAPFAKRKNRSALRPLRLCGSSQGHRTGHQYRSVREAKEPLCSAPSAALRLKVRSHPHARARPKLRSGRDVRWIGSPPRPGTSR
ncbi:MAG: hypothetical protein JWP01_2377 [Myxococcales bacterium]|nr:hypothetical protein [Myxococcales bacterium]